MSNSFIEPIRKFEIKNIIEVYSSRVDITEEKIRELEDKSVTVI